MTCSSVWALPNTVESTALYNINRSRWLRGAQVLKQEVPPLRWNDHLATSARSHLSEILGNVKNCFGKNACDGTHYRTKIAQHYPLAPTDKVERIVRVLNFDWSHYPSSHKTDPFILANFMTGQIMYECTYYKPMYSRDFSEVGMAWTLARVDGKDAIVVVIDLGGRAANVKQGVLAGMAYDNYLGQNKTHFLLNIVDSKGKKPSDIRAFVDGREYDSNQINESYECSYNSKHENKKNQFFALWINRTTEKCKDVYFRVTTRDGNTFRFPESGNLKAGKNCKGMDTPILPPGEPQPPVDPVDPTDPVDPIDPIDPTPGQSYFQFKEFELDTECKVINTPTFVDVTILPVATKEQRKQRRKIEKYQKRLRRKLLKAENKCLKLQRNGRL